MLPLKVEPEGRLAVDDRLAQLEKGTQALKRFQVFSVLWQRKGHR